MDELRKHGLRKDHAHIKAFIKKELHKKPDAVPRIISPRNVVYNCAVGPYIKACEKPVYRAIDRVFRRLTGQSKAVYKGSDARTLGTHFATLHHGIPHPVWVGLDAERFDQHVSVAALQYEHGLYDLIYHDANLRRMLKLQLENTCKAATDKHTVKWRVYGGRMSGDMNTSLGNTFIMCALMYSYIRENGLHATLANNGDDCVLVLPQHQLHKLKNLPNWFRDKGFTMKVEPPKRSLEEVEFCQTHCCLVGGHYTFVRKHESVISKDLATIIHLPTVPAARAWLHAVGLCGLASASGVPVQQAFYQRLVQTNVYKRTRQTQRVVEQVTGSQEYRLSRGAGGGTEVTAEARASYWAAFGVTPAEQLRIEAAIRDTDFGIKTAPLISEHDVAPVPYRHLSANPSQIQESVWLKHA